MYHKYYTFWVLSNSRFEVFKLPTYQFLVSFILGTFSNKSQISKGVKKYQISRVRVTVRISNGLVRVGSSSSKMIQVWVEFCKYIVLTKYQYIQRQISCDNWNKWVQVGSKKKKLYTNLAAMTSLSPSASTSYQMFQWYDHVLESWLAMFQGPSNVSSL